MVQVGQRRAGQGVEGLAAARAEKPAQPVCPATADRPLALAVRTNPLRQHPPLDRGDHFGFRRTAFEDADHLGALGRRQPINRLKPFLVGVAVHVRSPNLCH